MAKRKKNNSSTPQLQTYYHVSQRPAQALLFLLPLVIVYELSMALSVRGGDPRDIYARSLLHMAFDFLGVTGFFLPGILVVVVLFTMHVVARDKLQWRPATYAVMWLESVTLALPILLFAMVFVPKTPMAAELFATTGKATWMRQIVFSVGAGIYEELVFRMIGIALIHALLVDLLVLPKHVGELAAIAITAVLFSLYHFSEHNPFQLRKFLFYLLAGVYLACIYIYRGFGIVAGTHAMYDVLVVTLAASRE